VDGTSHPRAGYQDAVARLCSTGLPRSAASGLTSVAVSRVVELRLEGLIFASDQRARRVDELQETLGEGPAVLALRVGGPIFRYDIAALPGLEEWPSFAREMAARDVGSVYAAPVQVGAVILGVLTVSGPEVVGLNAAVVREVLTVANGIAQILLDPLPDAPSLSSGAGDAFHLVVHQATGMVSVQLGITLEAALLALRAASFSSALSMSEISRQVVRRERRFTDGGSDWTPGPQTLPPTGQRDDNG